MLDVCWFVRRVWCQNSISVAETGRLWVDERMVDAHLPEVELYNLLKITLTINSQPIGNQSSRSSLIARSITCQKWQIQHSVNRSEKKPDINRSHIWPTVSDKNWLIFFDLNLQNRKKQWNSIGLFFKFRMPFVLHDQPGFSVWSFFVWFVYLFIAVVVVVAVVFHFKQLMHFKMHCFFLSYTDSMKLTLQNTWSENTTFRGGFTIPNWFTDLDSIYSVCWSLSSEAHPQPNVHHSIDWESVNLNIDKKRPRSKINAHLLNVIELLQLQSTVFFYLRSEKKVKTTK